MRRIPKAYFSDVKNFIEYSIYSVFINKCIKAACITTFVNILLYFEAERKGNPCYKIG